MRFITRQKLLLTAAFMVSTPVFAVDLIGVHDLAVKNDPALQAAAYRRDATGENMTQAIIAALSERLERVRGSRVATDLVEEILAIGQRCAQLPVKDDRSTDKILGYGPHGAPQ